MKKLGIILIVIFGFIFRFYRLVDYPAGFSADEFSQGYTAYSLLKTGRDEWGVRFPLAPRAFGDFRSPLYTYLTIPSVAVFGLNEFSVRLPNAILGSLAVLMVYFLVGELGLSRIHKLINTDLLPLLSSFLLAISPWHISLSRGAFEANMTTLLIPLGIFLFIKGLSDSKIWGNIGLPLSAFFLGINMFSYFSPRLFTPILSVILLAAFKKDFFRKKSFWLFLIIFTVFMFLSLQSLAAGAKTRVADTSIFNQPNNWQGLSSRQYEAVYLGALVPFERIFNNKVTFLINQFVKNYLGYFSFDFLFLKGASEWTYGMIPGRGVLYLFEIPFLVFGVWQCIKRKEKPTVILLILLLFSPLAASLAKGERAANRVSTMIPFIQIVSACGALTVWGFLKEKFNKKILFPVIIFTVIVFLSFFLEDYFYHAPINTSRNMAYGWRQASDYISASGERYDRVIISKNFSEPQIAVAYFFKIDPLVVQKYSPQWLEYEKKGFLFVDQLPEYNLSEYEFRNFRFPDDIKLQRTLFVGKGEDFAGVTATTKSEKLIYYPGPERKIAFKIVEFKNE